MTRGLGLFGGGVASSLALVFACSSSHEAASANSRGDASASPSSQSGDDAQTSSDGAPTFVDAGPAAIQFIGRFDTRDPASPKCGWPGCRILARFEGPSVSVELDEIDESWMVGAPSEWDVAVDDAWKDKIVTTAGTKTYPLATGLAAGPHKVELFKRSEAQNGVTQFRKFDFGGGRLLEPPPRRTRRVEVIGDSAAAGFGIEGLGYPNNDCPGVDHGARWQNFHESFGVLLADELLAELHGTVYSGKGMAKNIWRPDTETMPVLFPLANPIDRTSTYDFAWKPDVVIVMIGGNDFALGQPDELNGHGPATPQEFTDAYRAFVVTLRTKYPDAHIFLTASPSVRDEPEAGRSARTNVLNTTTTVANEHDAANDKKVYAFAPNLSPPEELIACGGHGAPQFHARVASELATIVRQKTGW